MSDPVLKKLHLYTDANTSDNPSKTIPLTEETKVSVKGEKLQIETEGAKKPKKYEYKVESGDINKWKEKLDEEIRKPVVPETQELAGSPGSQLAGNSLDEYEGYEGYEEETYDDMEEENIGPVENTRFGLKKSPLPSSKSTSGRKEMPPLKTRVASVPDDSYIDDEDYEEEEEEFLPKKAPVSKVFQQHPSLKKQPPPKSPVAKKPMPAPSSIDDTYMDTYMDEDDPPENKKTFPKKLGVNKQVPQVPQKSPHFKKETVHLILLLTESNFFGV